MNLNRIWLLIHIILIVSVGVQAKAVWAQGHRFFYEGDGRIHLVGEKSGHNFAGVYRTTQGHYNEEAYREICQVFGAPYNVNKTGLSLRLIAFLDFIEDRLGMGRRITITSGYRNPVYNTKVRQSGGLAAKASLHQYGMAADFKMTGVSSERIWNYVKKLGVGGTGFYHGETVHLDVGPARSWDETTSGVGTGLSDDNKLIALITDFDRYRPNTTIALRFTRMTAFPIGVVPEFVLHRMVHGVSKEMKRFVPDLGVRGKDPCPQMVNIEQMASIQWPLPSQLSPGLYTITAWFCGTPWEKMPLQVVTPVFEIIASN